MNMMADRYASDLALVVAAQITQTIGYSCSLSAPLELLQDILQKFVQEFARDMHGHMEHANRIEPNLKDARLSIQNLSINVQELLDYIGNVEPVGFIRDVPQFPIGKTLNMNFLKPGSAETLTRPVYIFEYLPPMQDPELREMPADAQKEFSEKQEFCLKAEYNSTNAADKFGAKHIDSISPNAVINFRSSAFDLDVGRSVREMSSVVMTTGGFISPAIEGKLPEDIIPDIVEKFLGLDAPFSPTIIVNSLKKSPQLAFSDRDTTVNPRKAITSETKIFKQNAALLTSGHSESSIMYASNNHPMLTARTPKKNKKQKHDLICEPGQSELLTNTFEKAQEKSQRKALKMYKQTSKNQSDTSSNQIQNMRKLKKRFNRGSFDPNKKHLQKIFKKQSKLKQNDLQLDIDEKHFLQNSQTTSGLAIKANSDTENDLQADIPSQPPTVTSQVKNNFRNSIYPVQPSVIQQTQVLLSEKKSGSEPERSKLDVFKKISKPRTPRPDIGATSIPPGTGVSVFGSTMSTPALISLPSGTTITPTPSLGLNSENKNVSKINPCSIFDGTIPLTKEGVEMSIIDSSKPKKRGRKPGGKNVIKQTNFVSQSLINAVERKKSSQAITLPLSPSPIIISQSSLNVSPPTEPLNLCNAEQPSNNFLSNLYAKEKKDRKKYKSLPENVMEFDKSCSPEKASTLNNSNRATKLNNDVQCSDKFVTVSKALSNASIYPGIQTGMVPLLPLLQFPPRPGLIPTGPGLFPAVTGLVGFGNHGNRVPISPFIDYPGTEESVADTVRCLPIKESPVTDSDQFLSRSSTQTGLQMDRNYCNVAPLVPDSMKFTECKSVSCASTILENPSAQATSKINTKLAKEASGNPDDPIEVSDDSDESLHNRMMVQRKTPISSPTYVKTSFAELHSSSLTSATSIDEEKSKMDLRNIVSLSSNEPLKKFKNLVKQSIPDVKSVTHTPPPHSSFPQFNLPNFMGGDKFSLAGGADLIPLSRMSDSEYSSKIVPFSSLGGTIPNQIKVSEDHHILSTFSNYEDITITPTGLTSLEPKMRKHHKKLKKVKEGKNKKKKEKKDKSKKTDQIGLTFFKSDRKIKAYDKKQKKEKKKDKDKQILVHIPDDTKEFTKVPLANNDEPVLKSSSMTISPSLGAATSEMSPNQIPKLTLKLSGKSTLFSSSEKEMTDAGKLKQTTILSSENKKRERDNSPELARFSPLVTGPPKNKQSETLHLGNSSTAVLPVPSPVAVRTVQLPVSQTSSNSAGWLSNPSHSNAASSTLSASSVLLPQQLMLAPNTIMNNFVPANCNSTGTLSKSGLCSSPLNTSEENANAMQIAESSRPSSYVDAEGNRIWICPACGKVDDGSAMIGCDGCDAWYHWICVGITFAPKDNDDWFCRICVTKKRFHGSEKKKRRNKKK